VIREREIAVLALDSPEWNNLQHCYGPAGDIPPLLRQLESFPVSSTSTDEPWYSLWSSLCHQGDIYPASFAAVPHIVQALSLAPERTSQDYFSLPAAIEVARVQKSVPVPPHLAEAYFGALARLPLLAGSAARAGWELDVCQSALAAIAAATGQHTLAELLMELGPDDIPEAIEWLFER
jgi:hypothetical protein